MKKIQSSLLLFLLLIIVSCSKNEDNKESDNMNNPPKTEIEILGEKIGIPSDIKITSFIGDIQNPTFISAQKDRTFYFYKIDNKKITLQHEETLPETIEKEGTILKTSELVSKVVKIEREGIIAAYIGDERFIGYGSFVKYFVFSNNSFKPIEINGYLSSLRKRDGFGYIITGENSSNKSLLYDNDWNLLGNIESSITKEDIEYIILKKDNDITLLKIQNNKIIRSYKKQLPLKNVSLEMESTPSNLLKIKFRKDGTFLGDYWIFIDKYFFEIDSVNCREFGEVTYIIQKEGNGISMYKIKNGEIVDIYKRAIPEQITIDKGFGEAETFSTKDVSWSVITNNDHIFLVMMKNLSDDFSYYPLVFILQNNSLKKVELKNRKVQIYDIEKWGDFGFKLQVIISLNNNDSINRYFFYNNNWDLLYESNTTNTIQNKKNYSYFDVDYKYSLINVEEIIYFYSTYIKRINLKENIEKWELNNMQVIEFIPTIKNARLDDFKVIKDGDIWTFIKSYTLLNGEKAEKSIKININTGKTVN